jgi:hypothetical protein
MSKGKHSFKETDAARALRAALKAKLPNPVLRITRDGLEIRSGDSTPQSTTVIDAEATEVIL